MAGKKGTGRKKVVIRKVEGKSRLQVTFSKRKEGLFRKASELAILCGAQVGCLAISPGGKAFSFGHPSADAVFQRFLVEERVEPATDERTSQILEAHRKATRDQLNFEYNQVNAMLVYEERRNKKIQEMKAKEGKELWERPIEEFRGDMDRLMSVLEKFRECKISLTEASRGVIPYAPPTNVMVGGSYVGADQWSDPKGKGIAIDQSPRYDAPMLGSSREPLTYPKTQGLMAGITYTPSLAGPSYQAPSNTNTTPFADMMAVSSRLVPLDPAELGYNGGDGLSSNQMGTESSTGSGGMSSDPNVPSHTDHGLDLGFLSDISPPGPLDDEDLAWLLNVL